MDSVRKSAVIVRVDTVIGDYSFNVDDIVHIDDMRLFVGHIKAFIDEYKPNTPCPEPHTVKLKRTHLPIEME